MSAASPSVVLSVAAALAWFPIGSRACAALSPQGTDKNVFVRQDAIDPDALALLERMDGVYKATRAFSSDLECERHWHATEQRELYNIRISYRAPDHVVFGETLRAGKNDEELAIRSDGERIFVSPLSLPGEYTVAARWVPNPFVACLALSDDAFAANWLNDLFSSQSLLSTLRSSGLSALTLQPPGPGDGTGVRKLEARIDRGAHRTLTLLIGAKDHLLYKLTRRFNDDLNTDVISFTHITIDPTLPEATFRPPAGTIHRPLLSVLDIRNDKITLDKGKTDGVAVGDDLNVRRGELLRIGHFARLRVFNVSAHRCWADILSNTGGLDIGDSCIIVAHSAAKLR